VVGLNLAGPNPAPPFDILGVGLLGACLVFIAALIAVCKLKRDRLRLWEVLGKLEVETGLGKEAYFARKDLRNFRDPKMPFRRWTYGLVVTLLLLVILIPAVLAFFCFFDQGTGLKMFKGIYF
jgi:hypothetical protein